MKVIESITHKTNNFNKIKYMPISINQDYSIKESSVFCDNKKPNFSFSKSNGDSDSELPRPTLTLRGRGFLLQRRLLL